MQIKWTNLIALCLVIFCAFLLMQNGTSVAAVLGSIRGIAPGHSAEDRVVGLVVLGVVFATLVMLARILTQKDRERP